MANRNTSPTSEFFSTLKGYFNALSEGERTPTEVASAFNEWAREGAESIKAKIAEEVEATVLKMGFIKRDEYEKLLARVDKLERLQPKSSPQKKAVKKVSAKKAPTKKAPVKKRVSK
jgi:hypothetical protein